LGIQCLGYGAKRPEWLKDKKDIVKTAAELYVPSTPLTSDGQEEQGISGAGQAITPEWTILK